MSIQDLGLAVERLPVFSNRPDLQQAHYNIPSGALLCCSFLVCLSYGVLPIASMAYCPWFLCPLGAFVLAVNPRATTTCIRHREFQAAVTKGPALSKYPCADFCTIS